MMNKAKTFLLILGIAAIGGCASQGKNIMTAFQQDDITQATLQEKMKWLEPVIAEGDVHEQFRVVKSLRYNSKYNPDLEKRKLAVQGLIFISAFADDSDVRSSARSRLTTILNNPDEEFELRLTVIDGKKELILGRAYYEEKDPSLFSNKMDVERIYPDEDDREDALRYLIDHFGDLEPELQQHMVSAFEQILGNQPVCIEIDDDGCDEYDNEEQSEWKEILGRQINYWAKNTCEWDQDSISTPVKESLSKLTTDYPDFIATEPPTCARLHPLTEDFSVLEMRSVKIPRNYWQFGVDLSDASSIGLHASNLEFGFGNGETVEIVFGLNIDESWIEPLREKYVTFQYRVKNSNTAIGAARTIRTPDFSRTDSTSDDADGVVEGESMHVYDIDENELYLTSTVEFESINTHFHLYLGHINQKIGIQYFLQKPDISFVMEGATRTEIEVTKRETDTVENQDRAERESQASEYGNDILLGAKWNNVSLLKMLFVGRANPDGRDGIFNFRLYHSLMREKTFFVVTSPF